MAKELVAAPDDNFTKDEIAIVLTREWLRNDSALFRQAIESAHAFAVKLILQDLNYAVVPQFDGMDELLKTLPDSGTVRRIGAGVEVGTYLSSPGKVAAFTAYGNVFAIAKAQEEKIRPLNEQARAAKKSATK